MSALVEVSSTEIEVADLVEEARLLKRSIAQLRMITDKTERAHELARLLWQELVMIEKHLVEAL